MKLRCLMVLDLESCLLTLDESRARPPFRPSAPHHDTESADARIQYQPMNDIDSIPMFSLRQGLPTVASSLQPTTNATTLSRATNPVVVRKLA